MCQLSRWSACAAIALLAGRSQAQDPALADSVRRLDAIAWRASWACTPDSQAQAAALWTLSADMSRRLAQPRAEAAKRFRASSGYRLSGETKRSIDALMRFIELKKVIEGTPFDTSRFRYLGATSERLSNWLDSVGGSAPDRVDTTRVRRARDSLDRVDTEYLSMTARIALPEPELGLRSNLAFKLQNRGDWAGSIAAYGRLRELAREVSAPSTEASALTAIASAYAQMGQPDSALALYAEAAALYSSLGSDVGAAQMWVQSASLLRSGGEADRAIRMLTDAIPVLRRAGHARGEHTALEALAEARRARFGEDSARTTHLEILSLLRRYAPGRLPAPGEVLPTCSTKQAAERATPAGEVAATGPEATEGITLMYLGSVFRSLDQLDSAAHYYDAALRAGVGPMTLTVLVILGTVEHTRGDDKASERYLSRARRYAETQGDERGKAYVFARLALLRHQFARTRDLASATAFYDSAARLRREASTRAGSDALRISLSESDTLLFVDWALAWLARERDVGARTARLSALTAVERGRAQALLDLMGSARATSARTPIRPEAGDSLLTRVLRTARAVASYMIGRDSLIVWVALQDGRLEVIRQRVSADTIAARVMALREGLGANLTCETRSTAPIDLSTSLENVARLVMPDAVRRLLPDSGEILLVPHGVLALVPFAILPIDASGTPLGVRNAIRYAPSLATALISQDDTLGLRSGGRAPEFQAALIVANPAMPRVTSCGVPNVRLSQLEEAERAARWLADTLHAPVVTGPEATKARVVRDAASAKLIHFATHGFASPSRDQARESWIALSGDDGLLTVADVLDRLPSLQAELVVLSACRTGLGFQSASEGTVGLQRAFLARGARSMLVTLWDVNEKRTAELTVAFYRHWLADGDGPSKAEALRRAQRDLWSVHGLSGSALWGGFILVGAR